MITKDVKYIFNICSVINHGENSFFDMFPAAKMESDYRPQTCNYVLINSSPAVINGFCQLFPGQSKHHNDNPNLRLNWFDTTLDTLIHRLNSITSIAFPTGLNDHYLLRLVNFVKKYAMVHNIEPIVKDYNGNVLVDLKQEVEPKYFYRTELSCDEQPSFNFPYRVVKSVSLEELAKLMKSRNIISDTTKEKEKEKEKEKDKTSLSVEPQPKPKPKPKAKTTKTTKPSSSINLEEEICSDEDESKAPPTIKPKTVAKKTVKSIKTIGSAEGKDEDKDEGKDEGKDKDKEEVPKTVTKSVTKSVATKKINEKLQNEEIIDDSPPSDKPSPKKVVRKVRILKNKYIDLFKAVDPSWHALFLSDKDLLKTLKTINDKLVKQINDERLDILPCPYDLTFNCFRLCKLDELKVVILGQDPYFANKNEAMGLSFSVPDGVAVPPSLKNIFKELGDDIQDFTIPKSGNLTKWAEQGVLLLNTSLTVIHKQSASHMETWKPFTNELIKKIAKTTRNVVFILWGSHAKAFRSFIPDQHLVLESTHPSPMSAIKYGFFGNHHFSQCNQYLERHNKQPVKWNLD